MTQYSYLPLRTFSRLTIMLTTLLFMLLCSQTTVAMNYQTKQANRYGHNHGTYSFFNYLRWYINDKLIALPGDTQVSIRRTTHGVLHVKASGYADLGYGVAYAYTEDNRCLLAYRIAEVNGRLSAQLGPDAPARSEVHDFTYTTLQSDHYYRGWFDIHAIRAGFNAGASEVRELAKGYAAGINRFLDDHPVLPACEVTFTGPVTQDDIYRVWVAAATVASGELVAGLLPHQAPAVLPLVDNQSTETAEVVADAAIPKQPLTAKTSSFGSNAWAIGREGSRYGSSVHLYNPHFPWAGIHRLYMLHITIPGEINVMGVALGGFPVPLAGFNQKVAWGLTFSPAARWSLADLQLEQDDPFSYQVDNIMKNITAETLSIPVLGEANPRQIPFYRTEDGDPLIDADPFFFGWWDDPNNPGRAFAAHDVNADNTRMVEQFLRISQANNVHEIRDQLAEHQGVPWSYVVASDAYGEVLFADISAVPNISTADVFNCVVSAVGAFHLPHGIVALDGTRSECYWDGLMHPQDLPQTIRQDYVANSNNTYELPNLNQHLTGFSPILGIEGDALDLRAGLGLHMINDRLTGNDGLGRPGFTRRLARKVFHQARNRGAELLVDSIVADCMANPTGEFNGNTIDITDVCAALAGWDRRNSVASSGAAVFRGMWMAIRDAFVPYTSLFLIPASIDDPLNTPSGYTDDPLIRQTVRNALARVSATLAAKGIAADVAWGEVNKVVSPTGTFAMPGGLSAEGNFDTIVSREAFYTFDGWSETLDGNIAEHLYGTSYLHAVSFSYKGPHAMGLLPYSQATEPTSPWYLDQVEAWSKNKWFNFPFTELQILFDPHLSVLKLYR